MRVVGEICSKRNEQKINFDESALQSKENILIFAFIKNRY
mgnify:CR=1 FL=1